MTMPLRCVRLVYRRALVAALVTALVGCGLSRPATVKQTFLLQATPAAQPVAATPRPAALKMGAIAVAAPFRGKALVYRQSDLQYEADFYNEFFIGPEPMLTELTGAWLGSAGVFRDVLPQSASAEGDYLLEGFVSALYGDYRETAQPAAVVTAKFFLSDSRSLDNVPMWQIELTQRVALSGKGADALAAAMSRAWTGVLADLGRELATVKLPR